LLAALRNQFAALTGAPLVPGVDWRDDAIRDAWFESHFHYAADVVHGQLSKYCDPAQSTVLDFGCYDGITALALALRHRWRKVIGVDIDPGFEALPRLARSELGLRRLPANVKYEHIRPGASLRSYGPLDVVMSWSVFEHVDRPLLDTVVADLRAALRPGGLCFVQIDPLYYSPSGSHLGRFAVQPWAHLLRDDAALRALVMSAKVEDVPPDEITEQFRSRTFAEYQEFIFQHYLELNRITADELVALHTRNGFVLEHEIRHRTQLEVPSELLGKYAQEDLVTHEVIAVFRAV